jgi:hypothetical protein
VGALMRVHVGIVARDLQSIMPVAVIVPVFGECEVVVMAVAAVAQRDAR